MKESIRDGLLIGAYWFAGGYSLVWFTPYALQAALLSLLIGELLLAWFLNLEDKGYKASPILGYALFAPPLTMMMAGAIYWVMDVLGLFTMGAGI